jgi:hypothetical protein
MLSARLRALLKIHVIHFAAGVRELRLRLHHLAISTTSIR